MLSIEAFLVVLCAIDFAFVATAGDGEDVCEAGSACSGSAGSSARAEGGYYWPRRAANLKGNGFTAAVGPSDISGAPTWRWENPDDELHRHGPVIDGEGNIYMATAFGWIRKFNPDGELLWAWRTRSGESRIVTGPCLYNGSVYFHSVGSKYTGRGLTFLGGYTFSLSMQTGDVQWRSELPSYFQEPDSQAVTGADGVLMSVLRSQADLGPGYTEGTNKVIAQSSVDGNFKWDYDFDGVVWNFMPSLPGDGTLLFASNCGVAHRLQIQTGLVIWKAPFAEPGHRCSTAGGSLGPDGRFYVATNHWRHHTCRDPSDCTPGAGMLLVYRVEDGTIVMRKKTVQPLMQYPAVGMMNGRTTVVLSMGPNPHLAHLLFDVIKGKLPSFLQDSGPLLKFIWNMQYKYAWVRRLLGLQPFADNTVAALDVETGDFLWSLKEEPWDHWAAAGDEEGFLRRSEARYSNYRHETICGPDNWGIPVISGDGTVYASSGLTGNLYAIKDKNGNGHLDPGEVSIHEFGQAFVNGPALAPGLLAVTPCWGPMHVWKVDV